MWTIAGPEFYVPGAGGGMFQLLMDHVGTCSRRIAFAWQNPDEYSRVDVTVNGGRVWSQSDFPATVQAVTCVVDYPGGAKLFATVGGPPYGPEGQVLRTYESTDGTHWIRR